MTSLVLSPSFLPRHCPQGSEISLSSQKHATCQNLSFSRRRKNLRSFIHCSSSHGIEIAPRPVVILPGLGNNSTDYSKLVEDLGSRGLISTVAQVARIDWLRNAAGLLDSSYWKGTLKPRPVLDWYLERTGAAIEEAISKTSGSEKVSLVAHSAGGWLARLFLSEFGTEKVDLLLTLGSPHLPPPRGVPGVVDQTRGLLYYIEETCPGAHHSDVKYVCVAGRYLKGAPLLGNPTPKVAVTGLGQVSPNSVDPVSTAIAAVEGVSLTASPEAEKEIPPSVRARIIGQGYKQVCGEASVWGDGVVPEKAAFLNGALNISVEGVYHSPVGSDNETRPWYGSPAVLEKWVHHLLE